MSAPTHYLAELRTWLHAAAERFRRARQFTAVSNLEVARDITADAIELSQRVAAAGHKSETYDLEASLVLENFLRERSDLTREERSKIRRAVQLIHRSAEADHEISEITAVPS